MGPSAQAAPRVDSLYPAPCGGRFGVVLLVWVALSFKQDCEAAGEPHHKVGSIAEGVSEVQVRDFQVEPMILDPGFDIGIGGVEDGADFSFKAGVDDSVGQVALDGRDALVLRRVEVESVRLIRWAGTRPAREGSARDLRLAGVLRTSARG